MRMIRNQQGSAPAVALVVTLPILMVVCLGFSWFGHVAAVKGLCEEAARTGARYLATNPGAISESIAMARTTMTDAEQFTPTDSDLTEIEVDNSDEWAYCKVIYNYQVPIPAFWSAMSEGDTPLWAETPTTMPIVGEAYFVMGE